jgi:hypothetical protein
MKLGELYGCIPVQLLCARTWTHVTGHARFQPRKVMLVSHGDGGGLRVAPITVRTLHGQGSSHCPSIQINALLIRAFLTISTNNYREISYLYLVTIIMWACLCYLLD